MKSIKTCTTCMFLNIVQTNSDMDFFCRFDPPRSPGSLGVKVDPDFDYCGRYLLFNNQCDSCQHQDSIYCHLPLERYLAKNPNIDPEKLDPKKAKEIDLVSFHKAVVSRRSACEDYKEKQKI